MKDNTGLISEVLERIPNKYMAVIVSSKRARSLNDGARQLIRSSAVKPSTVALEEVAAGVVVPETKQPEIEVPAEEEKELLPPPEDTLEPENEGESESEPESEDE